MKISEMLAREDFYSILPHTLNRYALFLGIEPESVVVVDKGDGADLFVNERLNAIISRAPSSQVKGYLRTEYTIGGNPLRRLAVSMYLKAALAFVKGSAQQGLRIKIKEDLDDFLIYPCNKKIRLFDFSSGVVHTVLKDGFPGTYIKREVAFRSKTEASFIPKIIRKAHGYYSEMIIRNGRPLARIQDPVFVEEKKRESLKLINSLTSLPRRIRATDYLAELKKRCLEMLVDKDGFTDGKTVSSIYDTWANQIQDCEIDMVTSHGDFQPGNIWIDGNERIMIIDWETVKERSPFYDYAALFCSLRNKGGVSSLCERILSDDYLSSIEDCPLKSVLIVILAEELEYQTEELISFPGRMGLEIYVSKLREFEAAI